MKYIKLFESFNTDITIEEVFDIFSPVCDLGFDIDDIYKGQFCSIDKDITDDYLDLSKPFINGVSIRIKNKNSIPVLGMNIDDNFLNELEDSIYHFESQFKCKLHYIQLRTPGGIWFKNLDSIRKNMDLISFSSKLTSWVDVVFIKSH